MKGAVRVLDEKYLVEMFFDSVKTASYIFHYICFMVLQVDFPNKCVPPSLYIAFIIANIADPDEMQQTTKIPFQWFSVYK